MPGSWLEFSTRSQARLARVEKCNFLHRTDLRADNPSTYWSRHVGHELGHALGFRHEHTRPEAGTCFEDNNWRPLTPYDSASIMHYPQCNGASADLSFTATDGDGVRAIYGG